MSGGPCPARSNAMRVPSFERIVLMTRASVSSRLRLQSSLRDLIAERLLVRLDVGTEVRRIENLPDLDFGFLVRTVWIRAAPRPRDRFFLRLHLDQPESGYQLFGFGEGAV